MPAETPAIVTIETRARRASRRARGAAGTTLGIAAPFALWGFLAGRQPELVLPSPAETWSALVGLAGDGHTATAVATTLARTAVGVVPAVVVGTAWGAVSGRLPSVGAAGQPTISALTALPPVVTVTLGLVWLGPGGSTTRMVVFLLTLPLVAVAAREAIRDVDSDLTEMATAFGLSRGATLRHVLGPGIASPVLAATSVALGQAVRVAVMAELLSASDGVGAEIARARTNLETADLLAWAALLVGAVITLELAVLRPVSGCLLRGRAPGRA